MYTNMATATRHNHTHCESFVQKFVPVYLCIFYIFVNIKQTMASDDSLGYGILPPSSSTEQSSNLSFYTSPSSADQPTSTGVYSEDQDLDTGSIASTRSRRETGRASQYLESRGFGWLMEVEDEEEEKPLL